MAEQILDDEERSLLSWLEAEQDNPQAGAADPLSHLSHMHIDESVVARILTALRTHTSIDFESYKETSVTRRVRRRMHELNVQDARAYAERVHNDVSEAHALRSDLLIGVTRFLRDEGAIAALSGSAIPRLAQRARTKALRIWVAGCSTGEEAYSLAMLLQDALDALPDHLGFKLFATDVDLAAIEQASSGEFDPKLLVQLPEQLRERYFTLRENRYVVKKSLREKLLFSRHDVIQDPPFSHLDMISCRNLLIYLKPTVQDRVLRLLSAALNDGGILWLGASEGIGDRADQLETLDARWRIYAARSNRKRDTLLLTTTRAAQTTEAARRMKKDDLSPLLEALQRVYVPPCLVIDGNFRLLYRFGELDALLRLPTGAVTLDVRDLLPDELRGLVTALMSRARHGGDVVYRDLTAVTDDGPRRFDLRASTVTLPDQANLTALFFEGLADVHGAPVQLSDAQAPQGSAAHHRLDVLESELRQTRESLQATIEVLESSNEELQATNEELITANEELQSTNEELQTVNEELHTETTEYSERVTELNVLNADMERLLANVDVGIVLLDDKLIIRRFNVRATEYFNLLPQDVGRPLTHLSHRLKDDVFFEDCQIALREAKSSGWKLARGANDRELQILIRSHEAGQHPSTGNVSRNVIITVVNRVS